MMRRVIGQAGGGLAIIALATMAQFYFAARHDPDAEPWLVDYLSWVGDLPSPDGGSLGWVSVPDPQWAWILHTATATLAIASAAYFLFFLGTVTSALFIGGARLSSSRSAVACVLVLAALPWFAATTAALLDAANRALGMNVAKAGVAPGWQVLPDPDHSALGYATDLLAFPVAILALTLVPAMVRWMQLDVAEQDDTTEITGRSLPHFGFFVAAAVVVELATPGRAGAWMLFFASWGVPERAATGLFLLGVAAIVVQAIVTATYMSIRQAGEAEGELLVHRVPRRPILEDPAAAWSRLRQDRRFRAGLIIIGVVLLAAVYVRVWSAGGPNDVFNAAESAPPSSSHWLGLDYLGRDRLTRLASALGGSALVALIAAALATAVGAALVASTGNRRPALRRIIATAPAVPAVVWLVMSDVYSGSAATSRLAVGLAIGLVGVVFAERQLSASLESWRVATAPLIGTAAAVAAGAFAVEFASTTSTITMDAHTPTLGSVVDDALRGASLLEFTAGSADAHPVTDAPWAWFPPAALALIMIAGLSAMALAALVSRSAQPASAADADRDLEAAA